MASSQATIVEGNTCGNTTNDDERQEPDWVMARTGINLMVNNNHAEAENLFLKYPSSLIMYSGYSFAVFMDALMSFEEEKLAKAILVLKDVEKRCTSQNGWLRSISHVFGYGNENVEPLARRLETQIILADSQVCMAILTFLQQDLSGYFKGGWVLRKAWKVYQKTYKEILSLYKEQIGELQLPDPVLTPLTPSPSCDLSSSIDIGPMPSEWDIPDDPINGYSSYSKSTISHSRSANFTQNNKVNLVETDDVLVTNKSINHNNKKPKPPNNLALKKSSSVTDKLNCRSRTKSFSSARFNFRPLTTSLSFNSLTASLNRILPGQSYKESANIDKNTLVRLMGAISFGYGLFQLGVSLLPPSLTRLVSFLGFAADRQNGTACLMYARLGVDMRAPLASLALLWYHTIVRPFYAIDGTNVQAGVEAASVLIKESKKEFANSALFLFFAGRASRLNSNISEALQSFKKANEHTNHSEIKILCLHEIGWCYLIQLDYGNGKNTFLHLKCAGRWSRTFYGYLAAICIGASQDFRSYIIFEDLHTCAATIKGGQLDEFIRRRLQCCPKNLETAKKFDAIYFKLFVFEILYLWNSLASCSREDISKIIIDCKSVELPNQEPRNGLAYLILGSCYTIQNNFTDATISFNKCLQKRINEPNNAEDAHISAFAQHELGNILLQKEKTKEEGKLLLQEISKYSNYDFEARLNVRIHSTLKNL